MTSNWDRRTVLKTVGSTGALLAAGVGSAAAKGKPEDTPGGEGNRDEPNLVEKAIELNSSGPFEGDFDVLIDAVTATGLDETLSGNRQLTVFAPTDEAFGELSSIPSGDALKSVLEYHVTPGRRDAESVTTSDELPTLNGALIEVEGTTLNPGMNEAEITTTNIQASNGIIHVIDGVLLP